ncbi:MAG: T9SS type A sorting domain-containing protein [Ignavibacteriales bacterium]|nr:T9SS type A sorting domain-containing protein [Ignavibacteriales bacterium]
MRHCIKSIVVLLALFLLGSPSIAKEKPGKQNLRLAKTSTGTLTYVLMNANNFTSWVRGDGFFNWLIDQSWNGEFPRGSGIGTIFSEGIVFGGKCNDGLFSQSLRVTGNTYFNGMRAGSIINDASGNSINAEDITSPTAVVFAVRPDMPPTVESLPSIWPDLTIDAATFNQVATPSPSQIQAVAASYFTDWQNWPASKGAPWFIDSVKIVRNDAAFDPTNVHHIPGIPSAAKTIWFSCNDLDTSVSQVFAGSPPMGIEQQTTVWAYTSSTPLNNIIFKQVKLIYKGNIGAPANSKIDSMYIVYWSDPDIGDAADDYVGCDSTLNLGYAYNATPTDLKYSSKGLTIPASGYTIVQGTSHFTGVPTDSAMINFKWRTGYKYNFAIPLTAFNYFSAGTTISDPDDAAYSGTNQWYNLMRGYLPRPEYPGGSPYYSSSSYAASHSIVSSYCLSGDPTTRKDWVDGYDLPPGDRRINNVHGPITLSLHDTAEVVIALVGGIGMDNISSVRALKSNVEFVKTFYDQIIHMALPPFISAITTFSTATTISLQADARYINATKIVVDVKSYDGSLIESTTLLDDGAHSDGAAGDNIFAGKIITSPRSYGLYADAIVTYQNNYTMTWPHVIDNITTAGPLPLTAYSIASDNLNNDGIANPGENIRYVFTVNNNSAVGLSNLTVSASPSPFGQYLTIPFLSGGASNSITYNPYDPSTYFSFTVPQGYADTVISVILVITDLSNNRWIDTLVFPVKPLSHFIYGTPITQIEGNASGNFLISIVDSTQLKNHLYIITGADINTEGGTTGYSLKDSTTGQILVTNHPLPDPLGHTSPIFDGFKVLLGTIDTLLGMKEWSIPEGTRRFSPVGGFIGLGLEGFSTAADTFAYNPNSGTIGMAGSFAFGGIGTTFTSPTQYHTILLKLAAVDPVALWNPLVTPVDANISKGYRWLRHAANPAADPSFVPWIIQSGSGYPYQDFNYSVPFSAWDMSTSPPTRLTVGMFENNDPGASVDGRYWPPDVTGDNTINREFAFIFGTPYSTTDDPIFHANLSGNASLPMMWVMTCTRRSTAPWAAEDQFEIIAYHPPTSLDRWVFNTSVLTNVKQDEMPKLFNVAQNFPNPFNPATTIQYQLSAQSNVKIKIYNVLGQEVRTLFSGIQSVGLQSVVWNSTNDAGKIMSSGVYFYRVEVTPIAGKRNSLNEVRKMVLLK